MTTDDIRPFYEAQPFEPFELRVSNGRVYPVTHPEMIAFTTTGSIVVVFTDDGRPVHLSISQINSIEKLNRPSAA